MWKVGVVAAGAALLLSVLAFQVWPRSQHRAAAQPLSRTAVRKCARQVLNDWIRDGQIDHEYRRACYRAALNMGVGSDAGCGSFYGRGLCDDLEAKMRTSAG